MQLSCPKCEDGHLVTLLMADGGPSSMQCPLCSGIWLNAEMTEGLSERSSVVSMDGPPHEGDADRRTGLCPHGHGILRRARVPLSTDAPKGRDFFLERCGACGGVWFDAGELARLSASEFAGQLQQLWDPYWRKQHEAAAVAARIAEDVKEAVGEEIFAALSALEEGLRDHPKREMALAYLRDRLGG